MRFLTTFFCFRRTLNHENIVKLHGVGIKGPRNFMVQENLFNGNIFQFISHSTNLRILCVHIHDHANRSEPGPHRVSLNKAASSHQNEINSLSHNFVDYTFTS